jgi:hypothetical protein
MASEYSRIKECFKDGLGDAGQDGRGGTRDLLCGAVPPNLDDLKAKAREANRRKLGGEGAACLSAGGNPGSDRVSQAIASASSCRSWRVGAAYRSAMRLAGTSHTS